MLTQAMAGLGLVLSGLTSLSALDAGMLKFRDSDDGTTTIHPKMRYNPPVGAVGHGLAALFRADFQTLIEEDLMRIKTVLETSRGAAASHERLKPYPAGESGTTLRIAGSSRSTPSGRRQNSLAPCPTPFQEACSTSNTSTSMMRCFPASG